MKKAFLLSLILSLALSLTAHAAQRVPADEYFGDWFFPAIQRQALENRSGSCVYISTMAAGINQNNANAWTLAWKTEYGSACRGGSWPSRFEADAARRGLKVESVTGSGTYDAMRRAVKAGKWVAIGCGRAHFQTLVGYDDRGTADTSDDWWYVWNCNDFHAVTKYQHAEFVRAHRASGEWCIVLEEPDRPGVLKREVR